MFEMLPNVLRNLFSGQATRRYPYAIRTPFENVRGELVNEIQNCTFCTICAVKCPSECIHVDKKSATWSCDPFACVYCGVCADVCPAKCLDLRSMYRSPACRRESILLKGERKKKDTASEKTPAT